MRMFLDTEFTGLVQNGELISLALVSEAGPACYAEFTDFNPESLSDWHWDNVMPHLLLTQESDNTTGQWPDGSRWVKGGRNFVRHQLEAFVAPFNKGQVEVWADNHAYDWVFFCQLWGGALHIPQAFHYIVRDLGTLLEMRGYDIDVSRAKLLPESELPKTGKPHNALWDATITKNCFLLLES